MGVVLCSRREETNKPAAKAEKAALPDVFRADTIAAVSLVTYEGARK